MSARWYKRCGADFIHGTMMLSLEEKGAYSLCLDLIYDRGAAIPDDARWLSGVCGVSIRKWNSIRERLISLGKITAENGLISNSRAAFELVSAELSSRERAETGAKGGRKRAENAAQASKINDLDQAELKPKEKIREDKKEAETNVSAARTADPFPRPEWADPQVWRDFLANRKRKRLTNSVTAYAQFLGDVAALADDEWPPGRLLKHAAGKGWGSINDPRENDHGRTQGHRNGTQRMGGPGPDPTLALVRAATAAQRQDGGDRWQAGAPLSPGEQR